MNFKFRYLALVLIISLFSCKKLVEIPPPIDSLASSSVFKNDETAIAAVTGFYTDMSKPTGANSGGFVGLGGISAIAGLSSDELDALISSGNGYYYYYTNDLMPSRQIGIEYWAPFYRYIYRCNAAIEGLSDPSSDVLTASIHRQLLGEVRFLRGFFYFYLTNMFGDVPMPLTTDYIENTQLSKTAKAQIYEQIISDLQEAKGLLSEDFLSGDVKTATSERVRPTKWAATALLARVYLYAGMFHKAEEEASVVISNALKFNLLPINDVFKKNSNEAIWQLQPTTASFNTEDGRFFIIPSFENGSIAGPNQTQPAYLSERQLNAFEPGDQRRVLGNWIDTTIYRVSTSPLLLDTVFYAYKYKKGLPDNNINGVNAMTEYQMVLRLAEQYLIRAEARARQNDINGARQDLMVIRDRAGLAPSTLFANNQLTLLTAIEHERQVELFCEWGDRWFDLKRSNKIDTVMTNITPMKSLGLEQWESYKQYFPIPQIEINRMPNVTQTPGY